MTFNSIEAFLQTSIIIKGAKPLKEATIYSQLYNFECVANEKGIMDVYIDTEITRRVSNEDASHVIAGDSRVIRFAKKLTHANIIENCNLLGAYQEYELSDAIQRATTLVLKGELDKEDNSGIIIYLKNEEPCDHYRLGVWRRRFGRLSLDIHKRYLNDKYDVGDGILINNENL